MCSIMGWCSAGADRVDFEKGFAETVSRGPDCTRIVETSDGILGFHRLAIMGLTPEGMQPFCLDGDMVVCNGEIYGFQKLKEHLAGKYTFASDSDCELLLPLWREYGTDMFAMLDAEFACIIYDAKSHEFIAARDPIGIRPLYYGYDEKGGIVFASEPKNLTGLCVDSTIVTAFLCSTATSRPHQRYCRTMWKLPAKTSAKSWVPGLKSVLFPTQRSVFCCRADWIPRLSAPLQPKRVKLPSAPSRSAWTLMPLI